MRLSVRPATATDFAACFATMGDAFAYPPAVRPHVPSVWAEWLKLGALTAHLIEDRGRDGRREPVGLGATVFVEPRWIDELHAARQPYWRADLVRRWLAGDHVVMTPERIRTAQRDRGLTVFFVADALSHRGLSDEQRLAADAEWGKALFGLRGCRMQAIWIEVCGEKIRRWVAGCGLLPKEDWAEWWSSLGAPPPEDQRPFLLGATREEAVAQPGSHVSFLFVHDPPQFQFTARQQELLSRALAGATDDELATALHVSASAVKKRWVAIYDRVGTVLPTWLEAADGGDTRGAEKRRHLLNHLREHPAELHPANAARD